MFRSAFRAAKKTRAFPKAHIGTRFASTTTSKSSSWKGSAVRWAAAGAIVYYYNTSPVFAEEPHYAVHTPLETSHESEAFRTVDSIAEQRRAQARSSLQQSQTRTGIAETSAADAEQVAAGGHGELEEEAEQQGAFNEETGEINWECPCLGGMANGPCGEQFRAAFSCFVYSKEEPKGVECIEHFKTMQTCFREHPDIYGSEMDEEEVDAQLEDQGGNTPVSNEQKPSANTLANEGTTSLEESDTPQQARPASEQVKKQNSPLDKAEQAGSNGVA